MTELTKKSPVKSNSTQNSKAQDEGAKAVAVVTNIMTQFSKALVNYRTREGIQQPELAERLDLGTARYNQYENLRDLNMESGSPIGLLVRFAQLEGLPLSELLSRFEGPSKGHSERLNLEKELAEKFTRLSSRDTQKFLDAINTENTTKSLINDNLVWWVNIGLDILQMPRKKRLEIEIEVQKSLLQECKDDIESKYRKDRIFAAMNEILDSKKS
jgi:transcriptional regulator with XRE-family HTH domain